MLPGDLDRSEKPPVTPDKSTITGLITIAVVCCVVGTSLVWVVIICQTRKRAQAAADATTAENQPLNSAAPTNSSSLSKIGVGADYYISDGSSSQSKTDSFLGTHHICTVSYRAASLSAVVTVVLHTQ